VKNLGTEPFPGPVNVEVASDVGSQTVLVEVMDATESVTFNVAGSMGSDHVFTFTVDRDAVDEGGATENNSSQVIAFLSRGFTDPDPCAPAA
jgi:hypothetical protein